MLSPALQRIAKENGMRISSGMAYGMLNGSYVTFSGNHEYQRISIYVGAQHVPASGCSESITVSCAKQIIHTITAASGDRNIYGLMTGNDALPALVLNHAGSVVTINFTVEEYGIQGIQCFINELLPQISMLTKPQQCIFCGQTTGGEAFPIRLSADTVVPMHAPCLYQVLQHYPDEGTGGSRNKLSILGAVIGGAIGTLLYILTYQWGFFAMIFCVLAGFLASRGYDLLKGRHGITKIVTVFTCTAVVMLLGVLIISFIPHLQKYAALGHVTRQMFADIGGRMPGWLTYLRASIQSTASNYWHDFFIQLLLSLLCAGVGCCDALRHASVSTAEASKPRMLKGKA